MKLFDLLLGRAVERRIANYQNELITKHCEEVQNIYKTMRGWRHDYHNHIQALLALTEEPVRLREYLLRLNDDLTQVDTVLKSGNVMVDAILNSKLSLAGERQIQVKADVRIPVQLTTPELDLCTIMGNLLDNAMEACMELPPQRRLIHAGGSPAGRGIGTLHPRVHRDLKKSALYFRAKFPGHHPEISAVYSQRMLVRLFYFRKTLYPFVSKRCHPH